MPFQGLRRAALAAAVCVATLLSACGGGQTVSAFTPSRVVAFGDASVDLGQVGGARYSINGTGGQVWTERLASRFNLGLTTAAAGGTSYATGSARVVATPDAAGNAAVPTVADQISTFLAAGAPASGDLIVVSAGTGDVIAQMAGVTAGTQTSAQAQSNLEQAGRDLGAQVRRLVNAGALHVVVVGPYNLGRSPWAVTTNQTSLLQTLSSRFNEAMLVSIVDLGAKVLYVDAALHFNLVTSNPQAYNLTNNTTPVCTSVDPGAGIGIGAGQVNSALCTGNTLAAGLDPGVAVFADPVYFTPAAHVSFGDNAWTRVRSRW
jgi:phospholipase/lecithinase/hemolysin